MVYAEDYIKASHYSDFVLFYGRKVNIYVLTSIHLYIGRAILFILGLIFLQDKPYHGQVWITLLPTIVMLGFVCRYIHDIILNNWIKL